jgi:hypothetical protein
VNQSPVPAAGWPAWRWPARRPTPSSSLGCPPGRYDMPGLRGLEVEGLELGLYDHVAKPFSGPVLLQRVSRELESSPA